jgi:hypothetical protein
MKKLTGIAAAALMAAAVGGGLAVPTAANAQVTLHFGSPGYWNHDRTNSIHRQIWQLERAVDRAERRGTINRWEARRLQRAVNRIKHQYYRYARNGLTYREVRYLSQRVNDVRYRLRMDRLDWDREDYWRGDRWRNFDRDWDNDGVRNRFDRDIDGDGVPNRHDRYDRNPRRY